MDGKQVAVSRFATAKTSGGDENPQILASQDPSSKDLPPGASGPVHGSTIIGNAPDGRMVVRSACQACRKSRVKCEKKIPCSRCTRLNIECKPQLRGRGRPPTFSIQGGADGDSAVKDMAQSSLSDYAGDFSTDQQADNARRDSGEQKCMPRTTSSISLSSPVLTGVGSGAKAGNHGNFLYSTGTGPSSPPAASPLFPGSPSFDGPLTVAQFFANQSLFQAAIATSQHGMRAHSSTGQSSTGSSGSGTESKSSTLSPEQGPTSAKASDSMETALLNQGANFLRLGQQQQQQPPPPPPISQQQQQQASLILNFAQQPALANVFQNLDRETVEAVQRRLEELSKQQTAQKQSSPQIKSPFSQAQQQQQSTLATNVKAEQENKHADPKPTQIFNKRRKMDIVDGQRASSASFPLPSANSQSNLHRVHNSPCDVIVDEFNAGSADFDKRSAMAFIRLWILVARENERHPEGDAMRSSKLIEMAEYMANTYQIRKQELEAIAGKRGVTNSEVRQSHHLRTIECAMRKYQLRSKWDTSDVAFLEITLLDGVPSYHSNNLWSALFTDAAGLRSSAPFPDNLARLFPLKDGSEWFRSLTRTGFTQSQGGVVPRKTLDLFYKLSNTRVSVVVDTHLFVSDDGSTAQISVRAIPIPQPASMTNDSLSRTAVLPYSNDIPRQYSLVSSDQPTASKAGVGAKTTAKSVVERAP